jgi:hypothetical protein
VKEEDEWAAIARYNKYLFDKREDERLKNKKRVSTQMYSDLTEQVAIKKRAKNSQSNEDALYHAQVLAQLERMRKREEDEKREYKRIRMEEKR